MSNYSTSGVDSKNMGAVVDEMSASAKRSRKPHERRWYDNQFFDDGYHFRYVSRQENKIIDQAQKTNIYNPLRSIPKASRQIRGVANLLISNNYVPVVFPENVDKLAYSSKEEYDYARKLSRDIAKRTRHWLLEEFEEQDLQNKVAQTILNAARTSVSYIKVWPDTLNEKIETSVRDGFDLCILGQYSDFQSLPYVIEEVPREIKEIMADENFDEEQVKKLTPDNRQASSEIKEAYMLARYGSRADTDSSATIIQKEAFIKEYLNDENTERIKKQEDADRILSQKKKGDPIIRHTFTAGGVQLSDKYINMSRYPFAPFTFEKGALYQTPYIERFIPQNKNLDMIVSRTEKWLHTMGVGVYMKRKGETFEISNKAGGQIIEYENTPPKQMNLASLPPSFFQYIALTNSFIDEQGVTLTTTSKIPAGVKAAKAIESLKESEYSNLVMANNMLKKMYKDLVEIYLELADEHFVTPQEYSYLEKGEPTYFKIAGKAGIERREGVGLETPEDVVPISRDFKIKIEIQNGLAYTKEGRKEAARELGDYMLKLAEINVIPPNMFVEYVDKLFEAYQFGIGSEIMREMEGFVEEGQMTNPQMDAIKLAVAEVLKDAGFPEVLKKISELPDQQTRIDEGKIATAETIKDAGLADGKVEEKKAPSKSIPYKDLPPEGKVQVAQQAGIDISVEDVVQDEAREAMKVAIQDKGRMGGGNNE